MKGWIFGMIGSAIVLTGCKGKSSEAILTIDGEPISAEEYYYQVERKPNVIVQTNNGQLQLPVAQPIGFQVANDLVNQKLLEKIAKDKGVYPSSAEVDAEVKFRNTKRIDYVQAQTSQGVTLDQIKKDVALDLCQYKLITKGITVTEKEVDDFIKKNPQQFITPKLADILWIVVKDPKKLPKVDEDLKSGQSFEAVAKRYSDEKNIQFPTRVFDQLPARLKIVVDKIKEGGTSGWETDNGYKVRFNVVKITPANKIKIEPWMKEEIKRSIGTAKGSKTVNIQKLILERRLKSKVVAVKPTLRKSFEALDKSLESQKK